MSLPGSISRALILMSFVLSASSIYAQKPDIPSTLKLEEAIPLVIERNPSLAAARYEIDAAEGEAVAANKRLNPTFSLEFEDLPLSAHPGPFFEVQEITSRVDYEFETGGRRRLRTEKAGQSLEVKKLMYRDRIRQIRLQVESAFYGAVLAESNLEASQLILEQAERVIALNRVRFEQGDISALELNRIEVERLKFQDDVFQAELALFDAKSSLLALLDAPDLSRDIEVLGLLPVDYQNPEPGLPILTSLEELIETALKQRPDLEAGRREIRRAEMETRLQRAIRSPNITVGGGYKRNPDGNAVVFGVTVPLNVFNRNEGEIIRADADRARAANLLAVLQKQVQLDVQKAYNSVEINRRRVEYIRTQQLERAGEASRVTLQSYNFGGATLIDYLDAQRTYRDVLRLYNQALYEARISLYELSSSIALGVQ